MVLVDRRPDRRAIDLRRAGVDDARYVVAPSALEHVQRAFDIGAHVAAWSLVGIRYGNQRSQVKHDVLTLDRLIDEVAIFDISADDPHRISSFLVNEGEIAYPRSRIVS